MSEQDAQTKKQQYQFGSDMESESMNIKLGDDKAKSFVDKIKEMRTPPKKERINPEE